MKILDVGAGLGIFPYKLKSKIFKDIYLIETDSINIEFLKNYLNFKNSFKNPNNINKKILFDLITLNKVIEHVPNPSNFLKRYIKKLKKVQLILEEVTKDNISMSMHNFLIFEEEILYKNDQLLELKNDLDNISNS